MDKFTLYIDCSFIRKGEPYYVKVKDLQNKTTTKELYA